MDADTLALYRQHHIKRRQQKREALEARRRQILAHIGLAADRLKEKGAQKVLLFGSVLYQKRFNDRSDIDLLVYGLPLEKWTEALLAIEDLEELMPLVIDLKRAEELPASFVEFAEQHGKWVS